MDYFSQLGEGGVSSEWKEFDRMYNVHVTINVWASIESLLH